jgi:hypothetical protein
MPWTGVSDDLLPQQILWGPGLVDYSPPEISPPGKLFYFCPSGIELYFSEDLP